MRYCVLIAVAALALSGCITKAYTPVIRYAMAPAPAVPTVSPTSCALGIRPIEPLLPYKQRIVFRLDPYEVSYHTGVEWVEMPRDTVTRALTDALVQSKRFADVGNAADLRLPDFVLTGQLRLFDENRTTDPWTADCEVRLELRTGLKHDAAWAATLSAREPLERNDTSALPAAMSGAITQIVEQAVAAITAVEPPDHANR
ncbi:MAG TPA: ABC-type transport auxiliary lipoprotein family protein [Candidatus Hydrogenedentes bacterium]|nr:ABC-type transport auxiliary lipoprotein family protein [Candidatus Hydrogenedentota bacterium]HPG66585.1 ABC-type transport auxiliary lipoprotein family protein [Candidatus Hydrogenedentota bacterium]